MAEPRAGMISVTGRLFIYPGDENLPVAVTRPADPAPRVGAIEIDLPKGRGSLVIGPDSPTPLMAPDVPHLADFGGGQIYCQSATCRNRAVRDRERPTLVAVFLPLPGPRCLLVSYPLHVGTDTAYRTSRKRRTTADGFSIGWHYQEAPAVLECPACHAIGSVKIERGIGLDRIPEKS